MVRANLGLQNARVSELAAQYEIRSDSFAVRVFEKFRGHITPSVECIGPRKRNSVLKTRLRNVCVQNAEVPDDFGVRIGKNWNGNSEASCEVEYDFGPVISDYGDTETLLLIFRQCL